MIHNGCRVHTGNERVSTFQSWDPLILDLPSRFKTLPLCFVQGRVLRPKVFVVRCTRSHHQTENRTMGQPRLFLLRLTTCSSYPLLVNPTLNQLIGTRLQQACPHLLSFHTKNPRKRQTWSPQGEGHSVPGKLSEPPRTGQLHHTSAPREGSWTSAREHCCMFLPMTVDRNYYKWSIFVVFIELYLYTSVCVHTRAQDHKACECHGSHSHGADRCGPRVIGWSQPLLKSWVIFLPNCLMTLGLQLPLKNNEET